MKMKCTQHGLYGQAAFKNARVRPGAGDRGFGFFNANLARRHDEWNARQGYLERSK